MPLKPYFLGVAYVTIFAYIFWFLLPLAYAYLLFRVFIKEKYCYLIMVLNGILVIIQFYIMLMLLPESYSYINIQYVSLIVSMVAGIPVILLALMFKKLRSPCKKLKLQCDHNRITSVLGVLARCALCFIALIIGVYGFDLLASILYSTFMRTITLFTIFEYYVAFIRDGLWPLIAISYAYMLYKAMKKYRYRYLIIAINSVFLLAVWSVVSFYEAVLPIDRLSLASILGNTAIMTVTLAFIFRRVEKHSNSNQLSCPIGDSSVAEVSSE